MGTGGYVLCEYESVRQQFPEFKDTLDDLKRRVIQKAEEDWDPMKFGGMNPDLSARQFGWTTLQPSLFRGFGGVAGAVLTTWEQLFTATGSQTILAGANTGSTIYRDYKVGIAGFAFLTKAIKISEIKMQISDQKLPRVNIEEVMVYNKPALVFEEGFVIDEQVGFDLHAYVLSRGVQSIKPIGFQVNRIKDKLLTNTGVALG